MRNITVLFLLACVSFNGYAQQLPQYTQWTSHQLALNPAHAGIKKCIDVHALYRNQWVGMSDSPQSGFFTASIPIKTKQNKLFTPRHGLALRFEGDRVGMFNTNRLNVGYAAHFNFTTETRLSLGIFAGVVNFGFDHSRATTLVPDEAIMREVSIVRPDAHFGAWWNGKNYYVGLMINQLLPVNMGVGLDSQFRFHTAMNAGFKWAVNDDFAILPHAMVRMPIMSKMNADLIVNFDYRNQLNLGVGYRTTDAILIIAGFKINQQFALNYSFDLNVSALSHISKHTHEIGISFITCKPERKGTNNCALFE